MVKKEKDKRPGRPKGNLGPTVPLQVRLTPEQHTWIILQAEGASDIVRKWIDEAMKNESIGKSQTEG